MAKFMDNITFEVEDVNDVGHKNITLSYKDILIAQVLCYIGRNKLTGQKHASVQYIKYYNAAYFSLGNNEIYDLVKDFMLGGGLGIEVSYMN